MWDVVEKAAIGQVFLQVLHFPLPLIPPTSTHHHHHHHHHPSSGAGTVGQIVANIQSGNTPTTLQEKQLQ
jgi:hypothetical protein